MKISKDLKNKHAGKDPLAVRPRDWIKDLFDHRRPWSSGMKNPLVWIIAIAVATFLLYLRDYH